MIQTLETFDLNILIWVHKNHSSLFDTLFPFITNKSNWIIPSTFLILLAAFKDNKRGKIVIGLIIVTVGLTDAICAQILKPVFERVRPSHLNLDGLNLLVSKGGKWSMPSNHAANSFALAVILSYFYKKLTIGMYLLASVVSFSRVYVGVHFPSDVFVGSLVGYIIGWIILNVWAELRIKIMKKGKTWIFF